MTQNRSIVQLQDLHGRCALISGGAGHIGYAMAQTLAELGASVAFLDSNQAVMEDKARKIQAQYGVSTLGIVCDLKSEEAIRQAVVKFQSAYEKLDILINCAALVGTSGLKGWTSPLKEQSYSAWKEALEINLSASFYLIQQCLGLMEKSPGASIINVSSIYGIAGMDMNLYEGMNYITPAAYAASKGGLTQLTRYLATALAPTIRVNTITPGGIERGQDPAFRARYEKRTPLGRMGREEDLKGATAFLASDLSLYVTGQNIVVDGGWSV